MVIDCKMVSIVPSGWDESTSPAISTAITISAPNLFAASTATGLTTPPSTYSFPEIFTGLNMPGIEQLALTAVPVFPDPKTTSLPL